MDGDVKIKSDRGMDGKTKPTVQALHGCSDSILAEFVRVSTNTGHRTPPLKCATPQDLQGCG